MRRYTIALLLGLAALTATVSACGDDSDGDGVASAGGTATESAAEEGGGGDLDPFEQALAYSECMRENGVPEFPDPEQQANGGIQMGLPSDGSVDPESAEFKAAEEACQDMQPGSAGGGNADPEAYEAMVQYSECMRENGIAEFPDPQPGGGIMMNGDMGFDPQSDEFKAAQEACQDMMPGASGGSRIDTGEEG